MSEWLSLSFLHGEGFIIFFPFDIECKSEGKILIGFAYLHTLLPVSYKTGRNESLNFLAVISSMINVTHRSETPEVRLKMYFRQKFYERKFSLIISHGSICKVFRRDNWGLYPQMQKKSNILRYGMKHFYDTCYLNLNLRYCV